MEINYIKKMLKIKIILTSIKTFLIRFLFPKSYQKDFISNDFGFGRGTPVDRYYAHNFMLKNQNAIKGCCLEFGETRYLSKYGIGITEKIIFNYSASSCFDGSIIWGDIAKFNDLPKNHFDCIVCINVLNFIYDLPRAVLGLRYMLKQDGKLLVTMAGASTHVSRYDMERWGDYWRPTDLAATKLFQDAGFRVEFSEVYGNPYACSAQINGYSVEDLEMAKLDQLHLDYQVLITFVLSKLDQ